MLQLVPRRGEDHRLEVLGEFAERVHRLARGLMGLGLSAGDRVGLWSPNYAEWTLVQYATAEIGAILAYFRSLESGEAAQ